MKFKVVLWYLGVAAAAGLLVFAAIYGSWLLSVGVFVLALILKATNKYIPLPKIYKKLGVENDIFEGKVNHEKAH
ncbi:MAG: hypothetical protein AAGU74_06280 [Bacillota bacterium]